MFKTEAQTRNKFGDDVSTLNGIIKAYYDVVTVKKGQKPSYQRDSSLHITGALVGGTNLNKNGRIMMHTMSLRQYHDMEDAELAKDGFVEKELARKVEKFGSIYHVWSTYETRNTPTGPIIERGINTIELYDDGKRFWILSWFYDSERKDNPLPKKYLPH
jgi:hypothetical protein